MNNNLTLTTIKKIATVVLLPTAITACSSDPISTQSDRSVQVIQSQQSIIEQARANNSTQADQYTEPKKSNQNQQPRVIKQSEGYSINTSNQNNNYSSKNNANNKSNIFNNSVRTNQYINSANAQNYRNFSDWQADFSRRAVQAGYNANDVQRLMNNANYNSQVVSLDSNQAEFVKMPWQYVESAVSSAKIQKGRHKVSVNPQLFRQIENRYRVAPEIVTAIWGIESAFGVVTGNSNLASSLSTLAYEGRRRQFAENQLFSLLSLLNRGDVSWYNLNGSWAGGMGQTQFIPGTWISQGVDGNDDGRKNPWDTADSLSSTANYLKSSGWVYGLDPFYEVQLPNSFNYAQSGRSLSISQWRSLGVNLLDATVNGSIAAKLWLPAGKNGPALLVTKNFDAIKVYNNSNNYALGVSLLAKRINRQSGLQKAWPKYEKPITKAKVKQLQQRLTALGYDTNGADGVIGTNTRKAFQRWQSDNGYTADGFITRDSTKILVW